MPDYSALWMEPVNAGKMYKVYKRRGERERERVLRVRMRVFKAEKRARDKERVRLGIKIVRVSWCE